MNEKLQTELTTWLQAIRESGAGAKEFALSQAPDVVREMVTLGRWETTVLFVMYAAIIGATIWFMPKLIKVMNEGSSGQDAAAFIAAMVSTMASVIALILIFCETHTFLAVWFAPRIFVIERAAQLLGSMTGK